MLHLITSFNFLNVNVWYGGIDISFLHHICVTMCLLLSLNV